MYRFRCHWCVEHGSVLTPAFLFSIMNLMLHSHATKKQPNKTTNEQQRRPKHDMKNKHAGLPTHRSPYHNSVRL